MAKKKSVINKLVKNIKKSEVDLDMANAAKSFGLANMLVSLGKVNPGTKLAALMAKSRIDEMVDDAQFAKKLRRAQNRKNKAKQIGSRVFKGSGDYVIGMDGRMDGYTRDGNDLLQKIRCNEGKTRILKAELVLKVLSTGSSDFSHYSVPINPGLEETFPMLSQEAANKLVYKWKKLAFRWSTNTSPFATSSTGALGQCVMAVNYNPGGPKFNSFFEMVDAPNSKKFPLTTAEAWIGVECDEKQVGSGFSNGELLTRTGDVPSGQTIQAYDKIRLEVALDGVPTTYPEGQVLGYIHAMYEIELAQPILNAGVGKTIDFDQFGGSVSGGVVVGASAALPIGTSIQEFGLNTLGGTWSETAVASAQRYTFPSHFSGDVMVTAYFEGTGLTSFSSTPGGFSCKQYTGLYPGTDLSHYNVGSATQQTYTSTYKVNGALNAYNYIDFKFASATTITKAAFYFTEVNPLVKSVSQNLVPESGVN
jgi:hypothetical protein